jgi:hypothetical protein
MGLDSSSMQQRFTDAVTVSDVAVGAYLLYIPAFLPQVRQSNKHMHTSCMNWTQKHAAALH